MFVGQPDVVAYRLEQVAPGPDFPSTITSSTGLRNPAQTGMGTASTEAISPLSHLHTTAQRRVLDWIGD